MIVIQQELKDKEHKTQDTKTQKFKPRQIKNPKRSRLLSNLPQCWRSRWSDEAGCSKTRRSHSAAAKSMSGPFQAPLHRHYCSTGWRSTGASLTAPSWECIVVVVAAAAAAAVAAAAAGGAS